MYSCSQMLVSPTSCGAAVWPALPPVNYQEGETANLSGSAQAYRDLALAYKALPCADFPPTAWKPLMPSSLRAVITALFQRPMPLAYFFLAAADAALDTILPALFFVSLSLVRPPEVLLLVPLKTEDFARLPLAIWLFFMAFFIAFKAFIAFIGRATAGDKARGGRAKDRVLQ